MVLDVCICECFDNDLGVFVDFCLDLSNLEELCKMGLVNLVVELLVVLVE